MKVRRKHSAETRERMSKAKLGKKLSAETRERLSKAKLGKKLSAEHCEKISRGQARRHSGSRLRKQWNEILSNPALPELLCRLLELNAG